MYLPAGSTPAAEQSTTGSGADQAKGHKMPTEKESQPEITMDSVASSRTAFSTEVSRFVHPKLNHVIVKEPAKFDVLLGRGRSQVDNPGNRRLQIVVNICKDRYNASNSRYEKTRITQDIVNQIKNCGTQQGRFLRYSSEADGWVEVEDEIARLKVSQSLRYSRRVFSTGMITSSEQASRESREREHASATMSESCNAHQKLCNRDSSNLEEPLVSDEQIWDALGYGVSSSSEKVALRPS